jgi:hypothetical protein
LLALELGNKKSIVGGAWIVVGAAVGNERRKKPKRGEAISWLAGNGFFDERQNQRALHRHAPSPVLGLCLQHGGNV